MTWRLYYKKPGSVAWDINTVSQGSGKYRSKFTARIWLGIEPDAVFIQNEKGKIVFDTLYNQILTEIVTFFN